MAVSLAGVGALVQSVAATEIVVVPGTPLVGGCADLNGDIVVVNIDTGDSATATAAAWANWLLGPTTKRSK